MAFVPRPSVDLSGGALNWMMLSQRCWAFRSAKIPSLLGEHDVKLTNAGFVGGYLQMDVEF